MSSRKAPKGKKVATRAPRPDPEPAATTTTEAMPEVGPNLRSLRLERGLSLERLAQTAGVSRAMLGQIELGQSTPTIKTLWKISRALDVPFSALISASSAGGTLVLRANQTRKMSNHDGSFVSRALFPLGGPRRVEFYEIRLAGGAEERAVPHAPGTMENLVVNRGSIDIEVGGERHALSAGDAIVFEADAPHIYKNRGASEALLYLVMMYSQAAQG